MTPENTIIKAEADDDLNTASLVACIEEHAKKADPNESISQLEAGFLNRYPEFSALCTKKPTLLQKLMLSAIEAVQQKEIRMLQAKYYAALRQIAQEDIFTNSDVRDFEGAVDDSVVYNTAWYNDHAARVNYLQTSINEYLPGNRSKLKYYDNTCSAKLTMAKKGNWISEKTLSHWHTYIYGQQHAWYKKIEIIKTEFLPETHSWERIGTMRNNVLQDWEKSPIVAKQQAAYKAVQNKNFLEQSEDTQEKLIASAVATLKALETNTPDALKAAESIINTLIENKIISKTVGSTALKKIFYQDASAKKINETVFGSKEDSLQSLRKQWQLARTQFDALEAKRAKQATSNFKFVSLDTFINWNTNVKKSYLRAAITSVEVPTTQPQLMLAERQLSVHHWSAALRILSGIKSTSLSESDKARVQSMQQYAQSQLGMEINATSDQAKHTKNNTEEFEFAHVCEVVRQVSQPLADLYENAARKNSILLQTVMSLIVNGLHASPKSIHAISEDVAISALEVLDDNQTNTSTNADEYFILGADGSGIGAILSSCSSNINNAQFQNGAAIFVKGTDKATVRGVAERYHSRLLSA